MAAGSFFVVRYLKDIRGRGEGEVKGRGREK
jgi:hypothetical protein